MRTAYAVMGAVVATAFLRAAGGMALTDRPNEAARRVDVAIGGQPFTSYLWPELVM
jgi:hypothetical protein